MEMRIPTFKGYWRKSNKNTCKLQDSWQILVSIAQVKSVSFFINWGIIYVFQEFFKDKVE